MTEELPAIDRGVKIDSRASGGRYHLSVWQEGNGKVAEGSWPMKEYGGLIRRMWEDYLETGKMPRLLGQVLTNEGLVTETLHYIAPGNFSFIDAPPLDEPRESFLYWLKTKEEDVQSRIDSREFFRLYRGIWDILQMHLERLERKKRYSLRAS